MSTFNSPEDVVAWAEKCVVDDHERHLKFGNDLNPYCTPGARNDWQRGFDNAPPYSWELPARAYDTMFQRGRAMARLLEREQEGPNGPTPATYELTAGAAAQDEADEK